MLKLVIVVIVIYFVIHAFSGGSSESDEEYARKRWPYYMSHVNALRISLKALKEPSNRGRMAGTVARTEKTLKKSEKLLKDARRNEAIARQLDRKELEFRKESVAGAVSWAAEQQSADMSRLMAQISSLENEVRKLKNK